jgi:hypothetical protein
LYDQTFTSINLSSNGNAQFTTTDTTFTNQCLPWTHNYTIFPYFDDLYLVNSGFGIFTSISGSAPSRIFNIEWRAQYFPGSGTANFELRLYEGQSRFDIIYGTLTNGNTSATAGVQRDNTTFTQYFCNGSGGTATGGQRYVLPANPTYDFNNDCNADILWQNNSTGQRVIWLMNGTTFQSFVSFATVPTSWSIAGSGDFNGDGKADILWQNNSTGQRVIWLMNGTTLQSFVSFATVDPSWSIRNH